jgi:hypothetical protein
MTEKKVKASPPKICQQQSNEEKGIIQDYKPPNGGPGGKKT